MTKRFAFIALCCLFLISGLNCEPLPSYKPKSYSPPLDVDNQLRDHFRASSGIMTKEAILPMIEKLFQHEARENDMEMMKAIAKDFLKSKSNEDLSFERIYSAFMNGEVTKYIDDWRMNMYMTLIKLYDIKYDQQLLKETLDDPDFYGLTYDAYKIMTYKINEDEDPDEIAPDFNVGGFEDLEKLYQDTKVDDLRDFDAPKVPTRDYEDILNEFKEEMKEFVQKSGVPLPEYKEDL